MRSQLVVAAYRYVDAQLRARGGDARSLARAYGLPDDIHRRDEIALSLPHIRSFLHDAARLIGDPYLGVSLARWGGASLFGLLGFSSRTAPTVREALDRIVRYIRLSNDTVQVAYRETPRGGMVTQRIAGEPLCVGRHGNEFFIALLLEEGRKSAGPACLADRVWLAHPRTPGLDLTGQLPGGPPVSFDRGENGISFSREVLDLPIVAFEPALLAYLDNEAHRALRARPQEGDIVQRLSQQLDDNLLSGGRALTLARAARHLGVSGRTLQRRLAEDGLSFQDVLDAVRRDRAQRYVESGTMTVAQIALALGYSQLSPFLRAFKRWTGISPSQYRAQRLGSSA